jgi:hypothetical protein
MLISKRGIKNKAFITNEANPEGFYIYGNGDIEPVTDSEIILNWLESLSEKEADQFLIKTFGVFGDEYVSR